MIVKNKTENIKYMGIIENIENDDIYWYWLNNISGIGRVRIRELLLHFNSPYGVYNSTYKELEKTELLKEELIGNIVSSRDNIELYIKDYNELNRKNIRFTYPGRHDYPTRLLRIPDYPYALYYKGRLPDDNRPSVSIIGARNCTQYGIAVATNLAQEFSDMGIQIISGMALGIDTCAHKGAVQCNSDTYAVLGCGVDICYPRSNIELYMDILENGGIISEYPVSTQPLSQLFPARNRIISGLSDAVVVVEARKKSGSLITVDQALEQGKDVFVVPGRIGDKLSEGCNDLIKMGAQAITYPQDILNCNIIKRFYENNNLHKNNQEKMLSNTDSKGDSDKKKKAVLTISTIPSENENEKLSLASTKNILYSEVTLYPASLDMLIEKTGIDKAQICRALLDLELEGRIREISKNCYVRVQL